MSIWSDIQDRSAGVMTRKEDRHQYAHAEGCGSYALFRHTVCCDAEEVSKTIKEQKKLIQELKKKVNKLVKIFKF